MDINCFIIGSAKAATSSLAYWLSQHNDVYLIDGKESNYWRRDYYRGEDWYYKTHFSNYHSEKVRLDASTINCVLKYSPQRIEQLSENAEVKIILCVRNLIDRAFSHWRMLDSWRPGRVLSFDEEISRNLETFDPEKFLCEADFVPYLEPMGECYVPSYIEQGLCGWNVQRYVKRFGLENVLVLPFIDLINIPQACMYEISDFLGIPRQGEINYAKHDPNTKSSDDLFFLTEKNHKKLVDIADQDFKLLQSTNPQWELR